MPLWVRAKNSSTPIGSAPMRSRTGSTHCRPKPTPGTFMRGWSDTRRAYVPIGIVSLIGFGFTLWVFYPGVMTFDAFYVYQDMAKHTYGDWQSPAMVALWRLVDPIAPGSASILLLTAALYWLSFATIAAVIARRSP